MHINEIVKRLENEGPYKFVHPDKILGIDSDKIMDKNRIKWYSKIKVDEGDDLGLDTEIAEYLDQILLEQENLQKKGYSPKMLNGLTFVDAIISLICRFGSSYAGYNLSMWSCLLNERNAQDCLDALRSAYEKSDDFITDILRDFIIDFFRYGSLWLPEDRVCVNSLTKDSVGFLAQLSKSDYVTFCKSDARLFKNGSPRI